MQCFVMFSLDIWFIWVSHWFYFGCQLSELVFGLIVVLSWIQCSSLVSFCHASCGKIIQAQFNVSFPQWEMSILCRQNRAKMRWLNFLAYFFLRNCCQLKKYYPCVLYSSSYRPLSPLYPPHSPLAIVTMFLISMSLVIFCF